MQQPDDFFDRAKIDMDGTMVETTGECKEGMDISYKGAWGYHPLALTLANTGEVLSVVNRPGTDHRTKAPPRKQTASCNCAAKPAFARSCCAATPIFPKPVISMIGIATREFAFTSATTLRKTWRKSQTICRNRRGDPCSVPRYSVKTQPRRRRANVKEQVVKEREFENKRLVSEDVADFDYRPTACRKTYRMAVVRKNISVEKGEQVLFPEECYFFYITNERKCKTAEVVYEANDRCNQENHIAQLKGAVRALHRPDNLESNWAYMLMTALAWNLKAWWALMLPKIQAAGRRNITPKNNGC